MIFIVKAVSMESGTKANYLGVKMEVGISFAAAFFIALGNPQCRGPKPLQSKHMKNSPQPTLNIYGFS